MCHTEKYLWIKVTHKVSLIKLTFGDFSLLYYANMEARRQVKVFNDEKRRGGLKTTEAQNR